MGANWLNWGGKNRVHTWSPQKLRSIQLKHPHLAGMVMSSATHISTLYREFADALRDVLAENAVGLASRGRLREDARCGQETPRL